MITFVAKIFLNDWPSQGVNLFHLELFGNCWLFVGKPSLNVNHSHPPSGSRTHTRKLGLSLPLSLSNLLFLSFFLSLSISRSFYTSVRVTVRRELKEFKAGNSKRWGGTGCVWTKVSLSLEPNKTILQLKIGKELTQASGPQQKSESLDADVADNDTSI